MKYIIQYNPQYLDFVKEELMRIGEEREYTVALNVQDSKYVHVLGVEFKGEKVEALEELLLAIKKDDDPAVLRVEKDLGREIPE